MSNSNKLHNAVRLALGVSAGVLSLSVAPGAFAQEAGATDQDQMIEEIVTTGSRIKRADIESASPVTVLTRAEMTATGITDVGDLLQRMPSMSGSPIGTTTNNGGNGAVLVDLRGMGTDRTLTLINGQRVVDGGDYQTIPASMIERVEILKDGASAVYGADAVAGVVNIITRRDFDGLEVSAQTADWFDSKGKQDAFSFIAGNTFDGGNFVFGAEYVKQNEAYQKDVPWDFMQDSYYIYPEGCENQVAAPYDGTPQGGCYPIGSSAIPEGRFNLIGGSRYLIGTPAGAANEAGIPILHDGRNYNYAPVNYLQTPYNKTNIFAEGHFDLTDNVRFNTEFRANFRESAQELAPTPYFSIQDPGYAGFWNGTAYNGIADSNYYLRQAIDNLNAATGGSQAYVPATDVRRRMFEQPRRFTQDVTQYQFNAGLEGTWKELDWDVYINRGYRSTQSQDFGQYLGARLQNAMGPSADLIGNDGVPECYNSYDPTTDTYSGLITGCVPLNMFGGGTVTRSTGVPTASSVTQDMLDYVTFTLNDSDLSTSTMGGGSISGSAFALPGGDLGWAAGYGYWKQEYRFTPDSAKASSAVTGNKTSGTEGSLTNSSFFAEVLAPVFDNGSQAITLKGGVRYDDWDAFDGDTTYQLGVEMQAIEDLKFRATYGTVFRAPTIGDLYSGLFDNFPTFSDPCAPDGAGAIAAGCAGPAPGDEPQLLARQGGNPNLTPETGDTFTAGAVWTPSFGDHDFTATVDYWQISLEDGISSLGVQYILDDCYVNLNAASCALVTRRGSDYGIDNVLDGPLNVADQGAKGVDTEVRWRFDSSVGTWEASVLWAHLIERTKTPYAGADTEDLAGRSTDPTAQDGGTYASDKINYSVQWMWNDLTVGYLGEYVSAIDADTFCNCGAGNEPDGSYTQKIDSMLYHDLIASYSFGEFGLEGLSLTAGITNLTDEAPPYMDIGFNATTDPSTYRLFGRGYYMRATYKF